MKDRPILFSGPMVRAILEGRKTQTRRVMKPQPAYPDSWNEFRWEFRDGAMETFLPGATAYYRRDHCPYGVPGDRLWVRETFQPLWNEHHEETPNWKTGEGYAISYVATSGIQEYDDDEHGLTDKCKPSIFMPRWASRITLEITRVRVERVQDISGKDALAEGIEHHNLGVTDEQNEDSARQVFSNLWDSINAKSHPWASNPWVWAITFKRVAQEK